MGLCCRLAQHGTGWRCCAGASVLASELSALADLVYGFEEACVDVVINVSDSDFPVQVGTNLSTTHLAAEVVLRQALLACLLPTPASWLIGSAMGCRAVLLWTAACAECGARASCSCAVDVPGGMQGPAALQEVLKDKLHEARLDFFPVTGSTDSFLPQPEPVPLPRYPDRSVAGLPP